MYVSSAVSYRCPWIIPCRSGYSGPRNSATSRCISGDPIRVVRIRAQVSSSLVVADVLASSGGISNSGAVSITPVVANVVSISNAVSVVGSNVVTFATASRSVVCFRTTVVYLRGSIGSVVVVASVACSSGDAVIASGPSGISSGIGVS